MFAQWIQPFATPTVKRPDSKARNRNVTGAKKNEMNNRFPSGPPIDFHFGFVVLEPAERLSVAAQVMCG